MNITVLVENNTLIDNYFLGEPAVSFYIESDDKKILFDTGYSDILIDNADKMGICLSEITHIVLSHGHDDHTRGLKFLNKKYDLSQVKLIAHPDCFLTKHEGDEYFCSPFSETEVSVMMNYIPTKGVIKLTNELYFLGEIPRNNDFESIYPIGTTIYNNKELDDYVIDDTALVYKDDKGIFIITGCSHSGICNITEYAKQVCGENNILGILGGFHLMSNNVQLKNTIKYFEKNKIEMLYPCHCVSLSAKACMMKSLPVTEVGVGMKIVI